MTGDVLITALWGATVLGVARARLRSIIARVDQIEHRLDRHFANLETHLGGGRAVSG